VILLTKIAQDEREGNHMWQRIIALAFLVIGLSGVGAVIANFLHYRSPVSEGYLVGFIGGFSAEWLIERAIRNLLYREPII
jgi:hypothetical protein